VRSNPRGLVAAMIRVDSLVKEFDGGAVRAVDGISFEVPRGALVTLLGPSGCGKTTTLRSIAGLEKPTSGRIQIGERVVYSSKDRINLRANRRGVGMVFQSYAIWPHMTVFDNVAYPLRSQHVGRRDLADRVGAALDLVGLRELASRRAPNLSGGQQQRVALARALVARPQVLLLDEPLSNLDAKLRESMRQEIRELQQRLAITTLYVTHDQIEALAISDMVAVMSEGSIVDVGDAQRIYEAPKTRFVAEFIGFANVVLVHTVTASGQGSWWTGQSPLGELQVAGPPPDSDPVPVLIRLEDVQLSDRRPDADENVWAGTIVSSLFLGTHFDVVVQVGTERVRAHAPRSAGPRAGDHVFLHVDRHCCMPLRDDGAAPPPQDDPVGSDAPAATFVRPVVQ
jgi:iron(III) transport system ATP-binding protein